MDIEKCFTIFELDRHASPEEVKQAYKDMVNVWHPDRFSDNPRLRKRAEEKLKEINVAYEMLKSHLSSKNSFKPEHDKSPQEDFNFGKDVKVGPKTYDRTEAIVEKGTGIVLNLWYYLSSAFKRMVAEAKNEIEQEELNSRQRKAGGMEKGRAMGRGRGMGKFRGSGGKGGGRGRMK
jgi:DnaJ-class molecular chaperone